MSQNIKIIILAAGKGKRMESELPKVLVKVKGKSMIAHLLESLRTHFPNKPIAVVGHQKEMVEKELGELCLYAHQTEQLGTGHAVSSALGKCEDAEHIVVLSGDQPFIKAETVKQMIEKHLESNAKITFTTTEVPNFSDWYSAFLRHGRILRENGKITGIREYKDADENEKNIREVNAGCYVFDIKWLKENLGHLRNENAQGEYYLTDLFHIAFEEGEKIEDIKIDPREALGANTKEELEILEKFA